ncbi:ThuA domain-containing protein [Novosphingobium sp.]|uniref:ThuA domain-containing protein n=1 Tax=Novosphingobium sp. TaxID=1874826 RepID=UPI00286D6CC7|nr:ThuA domain-containing protein [Novosphingobium sp.]
MLRKVLKVVMWLLLALLVVFAVLLWRNWDIFQRVALGGVKVYETTPPAIPANLPRPAILVFSKTNAFRHEESIPPGNAFFADLAKQKGWGYFQTENGAAFSPEVLAKFDAVVFNNVSGDVFTPAQRAAFKAWLEQGGGYVGVHAAGDNSHQAWGWYINDLIGATFIQHTMDPQFQTATVNVEDKTHPATQGLPASWKRVEEWYSFDKSPRTTGAQVLITVDEKTYNPVGMFKKDLRMGDHPMVWSRCVGPKGAKQGRFLYSAFGHRAESWAEPENRQLMTNSVGWALKLNGNECGVGPSSAAKPAVGEQGK